MLIKDKIAFIQTVRNLLNLDLVKVVPNHGDSLSYYEFKEWGEDLIQSLS